MNAWFNNDRTVMDEEEFKTVKTEYIDTSGLYETDEFSRVASITHLDGRINSIKLAIRLQKGFINNFEVAYEPGFKIFKKYGYRLFWNNKEQFIKELDKIEGKEKKYISQLENEIKQLVDFRAKKNSNEETITPSRGSMIRRINSLGKVGYKIDMDKTTVEELSYMNKQQSEDNDYINSK